MITQLEIIELGVSQGLEGERDGYELSILSQFLITAVRIRIQGVTLFGA